MAEEAPPLLTTALACRCPRCGRGRLFRGFLAVAPTCAACGLDLGEQDAGDGPAVFIVFILGILFVPAALLVESVFAPPYWVHLVIWPVAMLATALALLRPFKALMICLQYRHKASDSGTRAYD